jgi:hypothetical protein
MMAAPGHPDWEALTESLWRRFREQHKEILVQDTSFTAAVTGFVHAVNWREVCARRRRGRGTEWSPVA